MNDIRGVDERANVKLFVNGLNKFFTFGGVSLQPSAPRHIDTNTVQNDDLTSKIDPDDKVEALMDSSLSS